MKETDMKNFLLIFFTMVAILFAQDNKGRVTLTLDGEKYDIPVNSVSLRKENNIIIDVHAEESDSVHSKMVSMELIYKNLTADEKTGFDLFSSRLQVRKFDRRDESGSDLVLDFSPKGEGFSATYSKSQKLISNFNYLNMRVNDQKITYDGKFLVIQLCFSGEWGWNSTDGSGKKNISRIKDCKILIRI
jgi:hypothetical protein